MIGPVVTGQALLSKVMLIGQAPGDREGAAGKPFAWTAGKTLFQWFEGIGLDEHSFRSRVYMAAVCRCFPGKKPRGGDRVPDAGEIERCRRKQRILYDDRLEGRVTTAQWSRFNDDLLAEEEGLAARARRVERDLIAAYRRLLDNPVKKDPNCTAKGMSIPTGPDITNPRAFPDDRFTAMQQRLRIF